MRYDDKTIKGFADAAHSLKLYRRADLRDLETDETLIEKLYVDPLQHNSVLETMLRDSTTFLIGRKGTGKSTIFQRAQHDIRKRKNAVSAYIDIKTVFEAAEVDPEIPQKLREAGKTLPEKQMKKVLLYRSFIRSVFQEIKTELKIQVGGSFFEKIMNKLGQRRADILAEIDDLLEGSFEATITDVTAFQDVSATDESGDKLASVTNRSGTVELGLGTSGARLAAGGSGGGTKSVETSSSIAMSYSNVLLKTFNINAIMEDLQRILGSVGITKLFIFIDDFSELPQTAMEVFVDAILAPLNNWSNELIKFKIAAYPGRVYLGKIDSTKIDEVYLDTFRLYGASDVNTMEDKAIDFTTRLINSRFQHFIGKSFDEFCDSDISEVYRQMFYASMANPRILGHLLYNLRESVVVYGKPIGARSIQEASIKYYEEKVEPFFGMQKFSLRSFGERSSVFSLKELLEWIVARARELRDYKGSEVTKNITGRTPSSHFHVVSEMGSLLDTLELNFFVTLYFEMKDRDGRKVSVFALNHGLCNKFGVAFGRPAGKREFRLYFVERIFDYTSILRRYLRDNQEIKCEKCETVYELEQLKSLELFGMLCPTCKEGSCKVVNLSKKYESVLNAVSPELLLPATELGIMEALYTEDRKMFAGEIAGELDCSHQLVGRRGRIMEERGLVSRDVNEKNRRVFELTDKAKEEYFSENSARSLDLPEE